MGKLVHIDLTRNEAELLARVLRQHLQEQRELAARTEAPEAQHDFALELGDLEQLVERIASLDQPESVAP